MRRIMLVAISLTVLLSGVHVGKAQQSDIPYLYYYSWAEQGFMIERADGNDQHFLPAPLKSSDHDLLGGPGWSPSGKWITWWSRRDAGNINRTSALGYIMSSDGQAHSDLLDGMSNIIQMAWSPRGDYLSVVTTPTLTNNLDTYDIFLFDVNAPQMITRYTIQQQVWLDTFWSGDGQTFIVCRNDRVGTKQIDILKMDGTRAERLAERQPFRAVHWHPDGRLGYIDPITSRLLLEDLLSGTITEIPLNDANVNMIEWNPNGESALYYVSEPDTSTADLWLLNQDGTQTLIAPQVDTDIVASLWSPDGQQAIFTQNVQDQKQFILFDLPTQEIHPITFPEDDWHFLESSTQYATHVAWREHTIWVSTDEGVYQYANGVTEAVENAISSPFPSPDERTLLFNGNCTGRPDRDSWENPPCLLDRASSQVQMLAPASHIYHMPYKAFQATWHSDSEWVLLEEFRQPGGSFYPQISVTSADGRLHRELTGSCYGESCYGWLPEQVTVLPPTSDQVLNRPPDHVLYGHTDWVIAVAWSPDGTKIASLDQHGEIILWDVTQATVLQRIIPEDEQIYLETAALGWNTDGSRLASWGYNGWLQEEWPTTIWDTATGTLLTHLPTETHLVPWPENAPPPFTPDIVASEGLIIDLEGEQLSVAPFSDYGRLNQALTPDASYIFRATLDLEDCSREPVLTIQTTATNELETRTLEAPTHCWGFIVPSRDKQWLAAVQNGVVLWNVETGQIVFQNYTAGNGGAFSPDNTQLAVASSYEVRIWALHPR